MANKKLLLTIPIAVGIHMTHLKRNIKIFSIKPLNIFADEIRLKLNMFNLIKCVYNIRSIRTRQKTKTFVKFFFTSNQKLVSIVL